MLMLSQICVDVPTQPIWKKELFRWMLPDQCKNRRTRIIQDAGFCAGQPTIP